jgi:hypothetical protein
MTDEPVTAATFSNSLEANLAKSQLEEAGIRAFVTGDQIESTWHLGGALGEVKLLVAERDLDEAERILAEGPADDGEWNEESDPDGN